MQVIHTNFLLKKKRKTHTYTKQNVTFTLFSFLLFQFVDCPTLTVSSLVCGTLAGLKNEFVLNQAGTGFEPFTTTTTAQWSASLPLTSFSLILNPASIYQWFSPINQETVHSSYKVKPQAFISQLHLKLRLQQRWTVLSFNSSPPHIYIS